MPQRQSLVESNAEFDSESSSESNSDGSDEELVRIRTAIAPVPMDATPQELCQALEVTQKALLNLRGRYRDYEEERTPRGSNIQSKERWISGVSIEDGIKAELFQFIPTEERELMNYHSFGSQACAGAIFSLNANIFIRGYKRHEDPGCHALLLSPHGDYTKFAPVLFPTPQKPVPNEMLKSAKLVQVLKVSLFGKSSLAATGAASSRTKAKIWKLRATTPVSFELLLWLRLIILKYQAIFLLSGDAELTEIGETTKIPYREYHNFFRQRLLTGGPWAHQVLLFFNDALFSTSSSVPPSAHDDGPGHMYEEEFERAMEQELEGPVFNADNNSPLSDSEDEAGPPAPLNHPPAPPNHPPAPPTINAVAAPTVVALPVLAPPVLPPSESISSVMEDLNLGHQDARVGVEHLGPVETDTARPKPKPKPKPQRKAKTADNLVIAEGFPVDSTCSAVGSNNAQTTWRAFLSRSSTRDWALKRFKAWLPMLATFSSFTPSSFGAEDSLTDSARLQLNQMLQQSLLLTVIAVSQNPPYRANDRQQHSDPDLFSHNTFPSLWCCDEHGLIVDSLSMPQQPAPIPFMYLMMNYAWQGHNMDQPFMVDSYSWTAVVPPSHHYNTIPGDHVVLIVDCFGYPANNVTYFDLHHAPEADRLSSETHCVTPVWGLSYYHQVHIILPGRASIWMTWKLLGSVEGPLLILQFWDAEARLVSEGASRL
ncbi:hypothetical protein DFH29DRAFT_881766 [Suillus ampliporus]|nr:hypothetical protein DFH29DRAFT_881766 [Suillus ampliporus]